MAIALDIFNQSEPFIGLNPRLPAEVRARVEHAIEAQHLKAHIWIASSGTEAAQPNMIKIVALSQDAFLISAQAVCKTLDINSKDVYYNSLPLYHVGGLSTLARAYVSGCKHIQIEDQWKIEAFIENLNREKVTITSLVPTQIFDLVTHNIRASSHLRFVLVGGGSLSKTLSSKAKDLGWPLISTYGMTETAAMIGYKNPEEESYKLFSHVEAIRTSSDQRLSIKSSSLLTGYLFVGEESYQFKDPKESGWFLTHDKAIVKANTIELLGRESELVKIKGESVSLFELNQKFESFCLQQNIMSKVVVLAMPHDRDGYELCLVSEGKVKEEQIDLFNQSQLPFSRISKIKMMAQIPTTAIGKIDVLATRTLIS